MVKQRMGTADVAAEVASLRQRGIIGMRLTNVYDVSSKVYVLKFARTGECGDKVLLLVESGFRFHTIEGMPEKAHVPSNFTLKLRKHVRTRRVESVRQLGVDRVVQLTFGTGEQTYHLILEFYAQGNVILTDRHYEVLTLLRSHRDDAKGLATMARHAYPIKSIRLREPLAADKLAAALAAAPEEATLKSVLYDLMPYGPGIAEHCILKAGLDPARVLREAPLEEEARGALLGAVRGLERWLDSCEDEKAAAPGGAILLRPAGGGKGAAGGAEEVYHEFEPLLEGGRPFEQHVGAKLATFESFDGAMAEFFGKIQTQRSVAQQAQREKAAEGKLENIRQDHKTRLASLGKEATEAERRALLIECNLAAVDAALGAVRDALAGGMDWLDLGRMIKEEKKAGNPVAGLIESLQLERNQITLLLPDEDDEEEEEEEEGEEEGDNASAEAAQQGKEQGKAAQQQRRPRVTKVEVDLDLTAYANARAQYDARRKHADKARRTRDAIDRALAAAEKKAEGALDRVRAQASKPAAAAAAAARKPYWFERFHWFISTENYLVVSGRDAQQNELLVKRYMRRGDAYVHADLHGASTTIVKNPHPDVPIPPLTLAQAGQACVCRSAAWDAKIVTSAWWVDPSQVSKTAPTGEYLVTGSFMIRGRKNYLPPQPLVMGLGWLFRLEEGSVKAHLGERAPRLVAEGSFSARPSSAGEALSSEKQSALEERNGAPEQQQQQPRSALEAFMDASVETLLPGSSSTGTVEVAFDRYGLADALPAAAAAAPAVLEQEQEEEAQAVAAAAAAASVRRHLSAKERQVLKKNGGAEERKKGGAEGPPKAQEKEQQEGGGGGPAKLQPEQQRQKDSAAAAAAAAPSGRAKGGKGGKGGRKDKYADQDEEERELALSLLQSAGQKKDRKQRKEERKAKLAARKAARSGLMQEELTQEDIAKLTARLDLEGEKGGDGGIGGGSRWGEELGEAAKEAGDGGIGTSGGEQLGDSAAEAAVAAEKETAAEAVEEEEEEDADEDDAEVAALLAAEGVGVLDEGERQRLTQLDELTGIPRAGDVLIGALPVCAPYQVLANYKHKVKLVPGTLKKGKAYRQAVELLGGRGGGAGAAEVGRELELMRAVPETEGINAMVGGVKLQVAGLQKLQLAKRAAKKKK